MIPGTITAGDSNEWRESLSKYPASQGWVLHYALFNATEHYGFQSAANGDDHQFNLDTAVTASWAAGRYDWARYVTHADGSRQSINTGPLLVKPDPTTGPYDGRSTARKMLDLINAAIMERATNDELDLIKGAFADRAIEFGEGELIKQQQYYQRLVDAEEAVSDLKFGKKRHNKIRSRFKGRS